MCEEFVGVHSLTGYATGQDIFNEIRKSVKIGKWFHTFSLHYCYAWKIMGAVPLLQNSGFLRESYKSVMIYI